MAAVRGTARRGRSWRPDKVAEHVSPCLDAAVRADDEGKPVRKKTRVGLVRITLTSTMMVLATVAGTGGAGAAGDGRAAFVAEARAAGLSTAQANGLQDAVDAYLVKLGGKGTQASPNQIDLNGAVLNIPVPGEDQPRQLGETTANGVSATECVGQTPYGWFCAYKAEGFTGANIGMWNCREYEIPWYTDGSWRNNQTTGTRPLLTFADGTPWRMPPAFSQVDSGVDWAPVWKILNC